MSERDDAYCGRPSAYDEAERISHDLPAQLERVRREARLLRDRLFTARAAGPKAHLTARERAAAADED